MITAIYNPKIKFIGFLLSSLVMVSCGEKELEIIYSSKELDDRQVFMFDVKNNTKKKLVSLTKNDGYPIVSPNGNRFAFYGKYDERKTWSIHTANIEGKYIQRLTNTKNVWDSSPSWSPDGKRIAFGREYKDTDENWQEEIWIMNSDGSEQRKISNLNGGGPYFIENNRILFHSGSKNPEICMSNIDGSDIQTLTNNNAEDIFPEISPNGKQIAFMSNRDGNREIYIMNVDGSDQRRLTFNSIDDWNPSWSPDSEWIIFSSENNTGYMDTYIIKKDGTELKTIFKNGMQAKWVK